MIYIPKGNHIIVIMKTYTGAQKGIKKVRPSAKVVTSSIGIRIALKKIKSPLRIALVHIFYLFATHVINMVNVRVVVVVNAFKCLSYRIGTCYSVPLFNDY